MHITRFADGRCCYSPQGWRQPVPETPRDQLRALLCSVMLILLMVVAVSAYWRFA